MRHAAAGHGSRATACGASSPFGAVSVKDCLPPNSADSSSRPGGRLRGKTGSIDFKHELPLSADSRHPMARSRAAVSRPNAAVELATPAWPVLPLLQILTVPIANAGPCSLDDNHGSAANKRSGSGKPRSIWLPRSPNRSPEPATRSFTVLDTSTSSAAAFSATRAAR